MDPDSCCDEILDFSKYLPVAYPEKLMRAGLEEEEKTAEAETKAITKADEKEKEKEQVEAGIKKAAEVEKEERAAKEKSKADKVAEIKKNEEANKARKEQDARDQQKAAEKKVLAGVVRLGLEKEGEEEPSRWERQKKDRDTKEDGSGLRLRGLDLNEDEK